MNSAVDSVESVDSGDWSDSGFFLVPIFFLDFFLVPGPGSEPPTNQVAFYQNNVSYFQYYNKFHINGAEKKYYLGVNFAGVAGAQGVSFFFFFRLAFKKFNFIIKFSFDHAVQKNNYYYLRTACQ